MDKRIIDFIAGLRAAGVRISVAESADALRAIEQAGIRQRDFFRAALQATLVKETRDFEAFQRLFPLYFGNDAPPPLQQPGSGGQLSEEEQQRFLEALRQMLASMTPQQLAELFRSMMTGQQFSNQQMRDLLNQLGQPMMGNPNYQEWMTRRALRDMQFNKLAQQLRELLEQLRAQGFSEESLQEIEQAARENMQALQQQVGQQVGQQMIEQGQGEGRAQPRVEDLMDTPFERLSQNEAEDLRAEVAKLAARLRSRMALRQRRGKTGTLDAKATIRTNQRFGGVPMIVRHRKRHLKPRLVILCDRSRSTETVVSFLLQLIYALADQVSRTRSYAYIDHLHDMSIYFAESRPQEAIRQVMENIYPTRSYSTDLGVCLGEFVQNHSGTVDHRTTVIVLGDGRNNENDPNVAAFDQIKRRARRVIWFNPEPRHMWGVYDPGSLSSDMFTYAPLCDAVHEVCNLRQLADAVDRLFTR
ncbi:VWA domain-containing protein [Candidatus Gracilibacteria bacterium]|nr:VWA domain-containing protein [Candidatus Gracilibacteria bacterium]